MKIEDTIRSARRISAPIIAVATPDPAATCERIIKAVATGAPIVAWDAATGIRGLNEQGGQWREEKIGDGYDETIGNPVQLCSMVRTIDAGSIVFMLSANRFTDNPVTAQAIWNLRDQFKRDERTLVLLGASMTLPEELRTDVIMIDEALPDDDSLQQIIMRTHEAAELGPPADGQLEQSVQAVRGLSAFQAEQVTAMSLTRDGINVSALWEQKLAQIDATPGLEVYRGTETFEDIGGVDTIKGFLQRIVSGRKRPNAVVFIDEIEKMIGGALGGDMSGVSQDQLGVILSYMQDTDAAGCIFVGPPGAAKSMVAKATGNEAGVPTLQLDLGAAKGSLVGQSEGQMRNALKTITAISGGRTLWLATCNRIADLPPELRRRFTLGTFFFDLPTADERDAIWQVYEQQYGCRGARPADRQWTGAEIRQCCDIAFRMNASLEEACKFIVPVATSAAKQLADLRGQAHGRYLSASTGFVYDKDRSETLSRSASGRAIAV